MRSSRPGAYAYTMQRDASAVVVLAASLQLASCGSGAGASRSEAESPRSESPTGGARDAAGQGPAPAAVVEARAQGVEFRVTRCSRNDATVTCTVETSTPEDREIDISGDHDDYGSCGSGSTKMFDDENDEHVVRSVRFGGREGTGCVSSVVVAGARGEIVLTFEGVPSRAKTVARLSLPVRLRESGMSEWKDEPLRFSQIKIAAQ